jgi:hypothetical protein
MKPSITKRYGLNFFINFILIILVVFLVMVFIGTVKVYHTETFAPNMNNNNKFEPGEFPISVTQPLLYEDYEVKKNTNVTKNNESTVWREYPVYPSSYKQETNNKEYWTSPDDGTCLPAEFCGTPYEKTQQKKKVVSKAIPVDANVTRINWWAANTCE